MVEHLKIKLFKGLTEEQIQRLSSSAKSISLKQGEILFSEDDKAESLFVIVAGSISIKKTHKATGQAYEVSTLTKNNTIGEMVLVEDEPRSATAVAITETQLIEIPLASIQQDPEILAIITQNISQTLSKRLRRINEITVKSMQRELDEVKKRNALGMIVVTTLYIITIYALTLHFLKHFAEQLQTTTIVTVPLTIIVSIWVFFVMKRSQFPYAIFGLTLQGWKKSLKESLFYSVILMAILLLAKYILVKFQFIQTPYVFTAIHDAGITSFKAIYWGTFFSYVLFAPLQEFIARGSLQSSFYYFLIGSEKKRRWSAIIISNLIFSLSHLHVDYAFAYAVFLPGLFWGWLYSRHKTLLGVSISHIILGVWVFFVLGWTGYGRI